MFLDTGNKNLFDLIRQSILPKKSGGGLLGGLLPSLISAGIGAATGGGGGFFSNIPGLSSVGATDFSLGTSLGAFPAFATGGLVKGAGSETSDSILAKLSNNEFILNASATRFLGESNLNYLNAGRIPPSFNAPSTNNSNTSNRNTTVNVIIDSSSADNFRASETQVQASLSRALAQADSRR